jgi:hypothetical protein
MVLGRPQRIKAEPGRLARQAEIFVPDLIVANFLPAKIIIKPTSLIPSEQWPF